jgi:hypothetical protein
LYSFFDVGYAEIMLDGTVAARVGRRRSIGVPRSAVLACAVTVACALASAPAGAQELDAQLQEIRTLVREKRFALALESLGIVARQMQDLRLETVLPAFPTPAADWTAQPALSLLEENEIWSNRIAARRSYVATSGSARIDLTIDVHTPFGPAVALSFSPLAYTHIGRQQMLARGVHVFSCCR